LAADYNAAYSNSLDTRRTANIGKQCPEGSGRFQ
jgi:hypothetical protein